MNNDFIIPQSEFPTVQPVAADSNEPLLDIYECFDGEVKVQPRYYLQGIPTAINACLLRAGAVERLKSALSALPGELTFLVFDAWRPISVQQALYDSYYKMLKQKYGSVITEEQLEDKVKTFVSKPSYNPFCPSVHNTGGAIDLTLARRSDGKPLPMGTEFDDFGSASNTAYFEKSEQTEVRDNRRLLYRAMTGAGFTNLPSEWWHFDYGTPFWSYYKKQPAFYCGILGEQKNEK